MLRIDKSTKSKLWLSLYVFVFVFDPPFIPIDPVYLVGLLTMGYVLANKNYRGKWPADLRGYNKFIIGLLFYFLVISTINTIICPANLLGNRIRCINASFVLTTFEIYCVIFVLKTSERKNLILDDIYDIVLWAGLLQALCALVAFLHPDIRNIFLKFASADMYSNEYFLERRGYGFATNLVDTYGYAIGLIAGIRMILGGKGALKNLICVTLLVFCTFVNSRTGLAVIIIGFLFSIFRSNNAANSLAKILTGGIVVGIAFFFLLPKFFDFALSAQNETLSWVAHDFNNIYQTLLGNSGTASMDFISTRIGPPDNVLEYVFGSGHSVYGTRAILGFATDIGYINLWWMYGLLGMSVLLFAILRMFKKGYSGADRIEEKIIILFLAVTYFMMLVKANLLGYNPGTCVVYLILFSILHYQNINRYEQR